MNTHLTDAHRFHSAATFRLNAHRIVADHLATKHTNTQLEHKPAHQRIITMVCATFYCHMDARTRNVFKCSAHTHLSIPPTHTHSHARARVGKSLVNPAALRLFHALRVVFGAKQKPMKSSTCAHASDDGGGGHCGGSIIIIWRCAVQSIQHISGCDVFVVLYVCQCKRISGRCAWMCAQNMLKSIYAKMQCTRAAYSLLGFFVCVNWVHRAGSRT